MVFDWRRRRFLGGLGGMVIAGAWPGFMLAEGEKAGVTYLRPGDSGYADQTVLFNKNIAKRPALVAVCLNEEGVREAVLRARREGLPVAVKSGGHSFEGFSLNDGGFVIDVSLMTSQSLMRDGRFLAGPATRLISCYETLVPQGRLLPAGSCAMVGISGLTLGGGYGIFSREHGLACDALQGVRMVDGRGEVQVVGPGSELFRACCGGGNGNYGVVTELEFETVAAPRQLWRHLFRMKEISAKQAQASCQAWFEIVQTLPHTAFSAFVLNHRSLHILVTDTAEEISPALASILAQLEKLTGKRYPALRETPIRGIRRYYGKMTPLYFKNASAGFYKGYGDIAKAAPDLFSQVTETPGLLYQVNTLGGAIAVRDNGTRTAYAHRDANFLGEIQSYWERPAQGPHLHQAVEDFQARLRDNGVHAHYCNYPDLSFADWPEAYYGKGGYARLQKVKETYDPDNIFRYEQSVRA